MNVFSGFDSRLALSKIKKRSLIYRLLFFMMTFWLTGIYWRRAKKLLLLSL
nr:MAG TPA: hypothetical protein [Caudoviricetes sp.]